LLALGLSLRKPFAASSMAAAVHRNAMKSSRQRLTLRQTRRIEPMMFSMMLVQGRDRRSLPRQAQPDYRQALVEPCKDRRRHSRRLAPD